MEDIRFAPSNVQVSHDATTNITLLRIKRKRTDEPLDALVVDLPETKRKRETPAVAGGLFTFAETIEEGSFFEDQSNTELLRQRIANLKQQQEGKELSPMRTRDESPVEPPARITKPLPRSYSIVGSKATSGYNPARPSRPTAPPVVASARSQPAKPVQNVTMYDAIPVDQMTQGGKELADHEDRSMTEFASMVNDYLQLNDIKLTPVAASPPSATVPIVSTAAEAGGGGDYVYDVFYFTRENKDDVEAIVAREAANVGKVSGLPPWEIYDYIPDDSDDDSIGDEADEDSNEENFYRNDYPEDETSGDEDWDRRDRF